MSVTTSYVVTTLGRRAASSLSPTTPPFASSQETAVQECNPFPRISGQSLQWEFYSLYFVPKKGGDLRPILDLRVLNQALRRLAFKMLTRKRIIRCIQSQNWFAVVDLKDAYFHAVPNGYVRESGMAVQGPPLRAVGGTVSLPKPRRAPLPQMGSEHQDPQLSQRLAHYGPVMGTVVRSQRPGATAPQPVGALGQLGKEQTNPCTENLFSQYGVGLGEYDSTSHCRVGPISADLPEFLQRQDSSDR
ncbi:Transposon Tf2-9 polyprotein [Labeo rohita]|uniref:Transposon Tf2-9 polyprotein n=1 Tax=Labeo rohita TaxID=84645 RepID=A0ABQ8LN65_LABRO|nr:Transposon Tf2-9 polyprotein [Labeo rohita]